MTELFSFLLINQNRFKLTYRNRLSEKSQMPYGKMDLVLKSLNRYRKNKPVKVDALDNVCPHLPR
jgi:hypothetical protein